MSPAESVGAPNRDELRAKAIALLCPGVSAKAIALLYPSGSADVIRQIKVGAHRLYSSASTTAGQPQDETGPTPAPDDAREDDHG